MITIDLQDGFDHAAITIRVDGEVVYSKDAVTTKKLIGFADSLETGTERDIANVEVCASLGKGIETQLLKFKVPQKNYVGLYVESKTLRHHVSDEPFGYG